MSGRDNTSYNEILKSTSIIGGARVINLLISMVRTKIVAILLGPSGVGLVSLYESAIGLTRILSGLGINQSGVRQVSEANGTGDLECIGRTVTVLRRACWFSGLLGFCLTVTLAWPISSWIFGDAERAGAIAVLGLALFMVSISNGQAAFLQGIRRISDLARLNVLSVVAGTMISVAIYAWMGEQGIVPVLLMNAGANLIFSWWLSRQVKVPLTPVTWRCTVREAGRFVWLGLAFMWSGLLVAGFDLIARGMIVHSFGTDATGIYQAAWAISGVFASFILEAMGADFYPRLTAVAKDNNQINKLVNEQTEIGILLSLSGLVATLVFSQWIIRIFYTGKFTEAASLLPWFVLGIFGRVISWPMGFIMLAKGASLWFAISETSAVGLHLIMVWMGIKWLGLVGIAVAFTILYGFYTIGMLWVSFRLSRFRWNMEVIKLLLIGAVLVLTTFVLTRYGPEGLATALGAIIVIGSGCYCLRQITMRLGRKHKISRLVLRVPVVGQWLSV